MPRVRVHFPDDAPEAPLETLQRFSGRLAVLSIGTSKADFIAPTDNVGS